MLNCLSNSMMLKKGSEKMHLVECFHKCNHITVCMWPSECLIQDVDPVRRHQISSCQNIFYFCCSLISLKLRILKLPNMCIFHSLIVSLVCSKCKKNQRSIGSDLKALVLLSVLINIIFQNSERWLLRGVLNEYLKTEWLW